MATITITVTVSNPGSGNKYYLDGVLQATYVATPGNTYKFDQADGSNSGHPLRLSITSDGTHNSGSAYTTGVTTNGTPGSAGAYTQIEVTALTVQALYYYCTAHSGMGGSFNTGSSATVQYQDREGFNIQNFSADQTSVGQLYYNTSSGQFKTIGTGVGTWASGTNTPGNRSLYAGFGTATASLMVSGNTASAITDLNTSYNGTAWSELTEINLGRTSMSGFGTTAAGVVTGGYDGAVPAPSAYKTNVEEWDGSSWTEVTNTPEVATECGSAGSQTAGLIFGGYTPLSSPNYVANTKTYDGTNWTEVNEVNTARNRSMGYAIGTQTAALFAGGDSGSVTGATESWDGSSWTTQSSSMNTARFLSAGSGSQTSAVVAGGRQGSNRYTNTELWMSHIHLLFG